MMCVFSYGGGVQSRTIFRLILEGDLEPPDLIIFVDTGGEPEAVHNGVREDMALAERHGLDFVRIGSNLFIDILEGDAVLIPAHTSRGGMLRRICTERYKLRPMRRYLSERYPEEQIELWLGISLDEATRMTASPISWIEHRYPLIELGWTRSDCVSYLRRRGIAPIKSACVFCPYRHREGWREILCDPLDRRRAILVDEAIRNRVVGVECFVHPSRRPLRKVEKAQSLEMDFFDLQPECAGVCGT